MNNEQRNYIERTKITQYFSVIAEEDPKAPEEIRYRMRKLHQNTFVTEDLVETFVRYVTKEEFNNYLESFKLLKELMDEVCKTTTDRLERVTLQAEILERMQYE